MRWEKAAAEGFNRGTAVLSWALDKPWVTPNSGLSLLAEGVFISPRCSEEEHVESQHIWSQRVGFVVSLSSNCQKMGCISQHRRQRMGDGLSVESKFRNQGDCGLSCIRKTQRWKRASGRKVGRAGKQGFQGCSGQVLPTQGEMTQAEYVLSLCALSTFHCQEEDPVLFPV